MSTHAERVAHGAELLDLECEGWEDQINLDTLDVASGFDCVLGQIYGDFELAPFMDSTDPEYGFTHDDPPGSDPGHQVWDMNRLTEEWRAEITRRLMAK